MRLFSLFLLAAVTACTASNPQPEGFHLVKTIPVQGKDRWDYVALDENVRHVYISHSAAVEVLDADSGKLIGRISGLHGVHGIAIAPELKTGFITNGDSNEVTVFGVKGVVKQIRVGKKPDAVTYDPSTSRVFVMNGKSNTASVIDAKKLKVIGTVRLHGDPEFTVADGAGHVYVNLKDRNRVLKIDSRKLKILSGWPTNPGEEPSSLAIDRHTGRLFIGCRNSLLVIMNANDGTVIDSLPIGKVVDATSFDPGTRQVISSSGDGKLTVVQWDKGTVYHVAQTVVTPKGSKTFGLDTQTHKLFVPAAEFRPDTVSGAPPAPVPGTFRILVFEK